MNLRRLSSFVATTLCAFAFLFAATNTPAFAKGSKVVGTLETKNGVTIRVNGKSAGNGTALKSGDVLETSGDSVQVALSTGAEYVIDPGTKVRIATEHGKTVLVVIFGGVYPVGNDHNDDYQPLPWLPAFANSNASFPSTGGGGSQGAAGRIPITNAQGVVVGYALTNAAGQVVGYTDANGKVLASFPPNSQPVSSAFPPGSTLS